MRKPPLLASLFAFLGLAVLLALGTWQAQKYLTHLHEADLCPDAETAQYLGGFDVLNDIAGNGCSLTLIGSVFGSPIIPVTKWGTDAESAVSYQIFAYLSAPDGSRILTNLGISDVPDPSLDMQTIQVTGALYKPAAPNAFGPQKTPEENRRYDLNMPQIEEHFKIGDRVAARVSDQVLVAQETIGSDGQIIDRFAPAALHKSYLQPETHLQYALFWYAMACALLCIFILRFCRKS